MAKSFASVLAGSLPRRGVLRPFRRDAVNDFASGEGSKLIGAELGQILGTRCSNEYTEGELPWRPEFGSLIHLLRHSNNDPILEDLARVYVTDAISQWHPTARVSGVEIVEPDNINKLNEATLRVHYEVRASGNGDLLGTGTASIPLTAVTR